MNKEDIIRMAREADFKANVNKPYNVTNEWVFRFAALVASAEREACADIAENWNSNGFPRVGVAAQIRARGQA